MTSHRLRRPIAAAVWALAAAWTTPAWPYAGNWAAPSSPRPHVMVFSPPSGEPMAARLQAELYGVGIDAQLVPMREDDAPGEPVAASPPGSQAVIRIAPGGSGIEVWVSDPGDGGVLRQSLSSPSRAMAAVIALRTMEFLRASLLPEPDERPARQPTPTPAPIAEPIDSVVAPVVPTRTRAPDAPTLIVSVGPGLMVHGGGLGVVPAAAVGAAVRLHGALGLEVLGILPLTKASVESTEGSSRLWTACVGGGARATTNVGAKLRLEAGTGLIGIILRADGDPRAPNVGASESGMATAGYLRLGAALPLSRQTSLRADTLVGFAAQRVLIRAGSRDVATWGRPFGAGSVTIQAEW